MEEHFLWWVEQIILKKIFSKHNLRQNFLYFCKVSACRIPVKNSIFQKLPKIVEKHFFWWVEQIILKKNYFLAQFKIVQNFHYFVRSTPVEFLSKIYTQRQWKVTRKSHTLNVGQYLVHPVRRTADTSTLNFMA